MMKISLMASLVLTGSLLLACNKEKNEDNCTISMTGLAGNYRLTAFTYKSSATATEQDFLAMQDACERDDVIELKANGVYEYKDLGTACSPNMSDIGSWSLAGNVISSDGVVGGTITSYDCRVVKIKGTDVLRPGDQMFFTMTKQ